MAQNGSKMLPKWSQVGPKTAPRGPQEGFKNNKNTKTRHVGPQEAKTPKSPHLLDPKLDPKLTNFGLILVTFCQHVYEDVSSSIFDGFWEASEPSFFDSRWSENTILTFLVRSLLASFSTPKTFPKSFKKWSQEGFKRLLKGYKKLFKKRCSTLRKQVTMTTPGASLKMCHAAHRHRSKFEHSNDLPFRLVIKGRRKEERQHEGPSVHAKGGWNM